MMKTAPKLLPPPTWWSSRRADDDIVLATIGRMVRNLRGHAFPGWSTPESRAAVAERILPAVMALPDCNGAFCAEMSELSYETRRALLSCKLLTPCMAARGNGCHVVIPRRRHALFLINEEEHLVIHSFARGSACDKVAAGLQKFDRALESRLAFARDAAFGYHSSLPSEAGDGLQLYQVLHLPALTMAGMMPQITRATEKLHINISPFYADGMDDTGNTYVFFSIPGPEGSAETLAEYFESVMAHLVLRERQVRLRLQQNSPNQLADCIGRAYGLLSYACRLSLKELRDTLSVLRLGTAMGYLTWEAGPAAAIADMRELESRLAVESSLADEAGEEALPASRARAVRRFLNISPHFFNNTLDEQ